MMRTAALAAACLLAPTLGLCQPATDASVHKLLQVTKVEGLTNSYASQFRPMMEAMIMRNAPSPAERDKALAELRATGPALEKILKDEFAYKKLEPDYIALYKNTFTEEEVKGMIDFYGTPAGKAMVDKMPKVMDQTVALLQQHMPRVMQRMQEVMKAK